jgi:hypothetical protein
MQHVLTLSIYSRYTIPWSYVHDSTFKIKLYYKIRLNSSVPRVKIFPETNQIQDIIPAKDSITLSYIVKQCSRINSNLEGSVQ